jgi:hypothetical protein
MGARGAWLPRTVVAGPGSLHYDEAPPVLERAPVGAKL